MLRRKLRLQRRLMDMLIHVHAIVFVCLTSPRRTATVVNFRRFIHYYRRVAWLVVLLLVLERLCVQLLFGSPL